MELLGKGSAFEDWCISQEGCLTMHIPGVLILLACTMALCAAAPGKGDSLQG